MNSSRMLNYKTWQVAFIALVLSFSGVCALFAWGQSGSGRDIPKANANKNTPAPRRTPSPRKGPRTNRSAAPATSREPEGHPPKLDTAGANERTFWETIRNSTDPADFQAYLEKYPGGEFAALARNRLRRLEADKPLANSNANTSAQSNTNSINPSRPSASPTVSLPPNSVSAVPAAAKTDSNTSTISNAAKKAESPNRFQSGFGLEFAWIPPGRFTMGSNNGGGDERPAHDVSIKEGFYLGRTEVTQSEWRAVMSTTIQQQRDKVNPSGAMRGEGDKYPMYYVSWIEVQEFIRRLNQRNDGYTYRLPTEAEWEYACRAGTTADYNGVLDTMAWFGNNSGRQTIDAAEIWRTDQINYVSRIIDNGNRTHPVGEKQPNGFGLFDMNGNLWEWCEDLYHWGYNAAPTDGSIWLSGGEKDIRVLRGGSWDFNSAFLRSTTRRGLSQDLHGNYFGFRIVAVVRPL